MIRGTTPTFIIKLKDESIDLHVADSLIVTISQGVYVVNKMGDDIELEDGRTVHVFLTQEESLRFKSGAPAELQLNWTYLDKNGIVRRASTPVKEIKIDKQLYGRVIE